MADSDSDEISESMEDFVFNADSDSDNSILSDSDSSTESLESSPSKTYGSVKISLIKDEIKNQQVDVIVNSTSSSLDLTQGKASRALSQAAGESVQKACTDNYPDGISEIDIAETVGGNLHCKKIYHLSLQKWQSESSQKILQKLVRKCLKKASDSTMSSIAFPALGTGLLDYDRDTVARTMLKCVGRFANLNTDTSLTDVRFIIFHADDTTYEAFRRIFNEDNSGTSVRTSVQAARVGQIEVKLETGNIIDQKCDVMMTTSTCKLDLSKGTLSQKFLDAAGPNLQSECSSKYPNGIKHGEIAKLSPGNMACKKIYCGAIPRFDKPPDGSDPKQLLKSVVTESLNEASNDNLASICFPTLGTGYLMYKPEVSASLMFEAIKEFATKRNSSLKTVIVVVHSTEDTISKLLEPFKSQHLAILQANQIPTVSMPKKSEELSPSVDNTTAPTPAPRLASKPAPQPRLSVAAKRLSTKHMSQIVNMFRRPSSASPRLTAEQSNVNTSSSKEEDEVCVNGAVAVPSRNTSEFCMYMYQLEIKPPEYWTFYKNSKTVKQWQVTEQGKQGYKLEEVTGSTLKSIQKLVDSTWQMNKIGHGRDAEGLKGLGYSSLKVTKVQRIENLKLYETYRQKQQNLFHKAGQGSLFKKLSETNAKFGNPQTEEHLDKSLKDSLYGEVNEGFFFHGTKDKNVTGLIKDGIDPRLAAGQAVFGKAVYLAESSTKGDQYADERGEDTRRKDNLKMFLVRCSLGDMGLVKSPQKFNRPPCCLAECFKDNCDHDERYDSIVEEEKYIFREFVIYEGSQTYPEYLITYNRV